MEKIERIFLTSGMTLIIVLIITILINLFLIHFYNMENIFQFDLRYCGIGIILGQILTIPIEYVLTRNNSDDETK